ncbi:MAG: GGDEF domain-containing protein [Burkholderiaceae bacterium]|nr:GGDEF domain-containing protein [Burkholderiaceae bacterium]
MWQALRGWLGPRPGRTLILVTAVLTPIGYGLGFGSYAFRVGWSNFGLALQMTMVCAACAWPAPQTSRRWRGLIIACLGGLAAVTLTRGVLGAFFTELYPTLRTPHPINVMGAVLNHIALTLTTIGLLVGWHEEAENDLRRQADTDGLTGLLNRRAWLMRASARFNLARRDGDSIAVLLLDIDHFKRINDQFGHEAGDRALQVVARTLRDCARRSDLVCRYGGEEFCLLLTGVEDASARDVDTRLRAALRQQAAAGAGLGIDFSSGLALLCDGDADLQSLLRRADAALYQAKHAGRGRLMRCDDMVRCLPHGALKASLYEGSTT